jgi:hypothetical protein
LIMLVHRCLHDCSDAPRPVGRRRAVERMPYRTSSQNRTKHEPAVRVCPTSGAFASGAVGDRFLRRGSPQLSYGRNRACDSRQPSSP